MGKFYQGIQIEITDLMKTNVLMQSGSEATAGDLDWLEQE